MSLRGALRYLLTAIKGNKTMLKPGERAPEFEAKDAFGRDVRLKDYRGRKVVLWFFPKANTPGWTNEGTGFRDLYDDYKTLGVEIIGCSTDKPEASRKFAEKFEFPYPLIPDTGKQICVMYGACESEKDGFAKRIAYLIDENGRIAEAHGSVSAARYPQEQLASLAEASGSSS